MQRLTPAVQAIPPLEGAGHAENEACALLRARFSTLIRHPELALEEDVQSALQAVHAGNVRRFGWQTAEAIRAHAFADAAQNTIPVGEATESGFGPLTLEPLR